MTKATINQLIKESRSRKSTSAAKKGESRAGQVWLQGTPVYAPDGAVALRLADGTSVLLLAKDIIDVDRDDGGEFRVAVAVDTDVIVARSAVRSALEVASPKPGCGCSEGSAMAVRAIGGGGLGSCIAHCDALENYCYGSGPSFDLFGGTTNTGSIQDALIHGAKCRDIWTGCTSRCFDQIFSRF